MSQLTPARFLTNGSMAGVLLSTRSGEKGRVQSSSEEEEEVKKRRAFAYLLHPLPGSKRTRLLLSSHVVHPLFGK